jgi:AmmeMemoRadiSam system protein A
MWVSKMPQHSLNSKDKQLLLKLARVTIERALSGEVQGERDDFQPSSRLQEPGAAFVTLHTNAGLLRGCIGSLQARRSLFDDVRNNALAAAFQDPRFPPLTLHELPDVVIEVSVLSRPEVLQYMDATDLVQKLRPGIDGVILESGWHRSTFLPQVWDQLPSHEDFLGHLCIKAGLSAGAWRNASMKISTYQVEEFDEESLV